MAKQKGIAENAEKMLNKWSNELGEFRKERETKLKEMDDAKKALEEAHKTISELQGKKQGAGTEGATDKETPEQIEKSLSADQREAAEKVFAQLSDDDKIRYAEDVEFRRTFLATAKETIKSVPTTPWITQKVAQDKKAPDATEKRIQDLFQTNKKRRSAYPLGSQRGENQASGDGKVQNQTRQRTAVAAGVLGM